MSMTAFARRQEEYPWGSLVWEIRSVNHRYLEPGLRLPDTLRSIEPKVRDLLRASLSRGKVECQVRFQLNDKGPEEFSVNTPLVNQLSNTAQQIAELTATGCDIVRVACPSQDDAEALPAIARKSQIPVIADIHFQPKYVFAAIEAGCGAVRVNPGNIRKFDDKVKEIAKAASDAGVSLRIGVNAGSLDPRLLKAILQQDLGIDLPIEQAVHVNQPRTQQLALLGVPARC